METVGSFEATAESGTGPILLNWAVPPTSERSSTGRGILETGSGTGPILKLGGPADVRAIFNRARHFDFGPPFAGDPWDDRPTLGPNVARFPSAIPAGQRGGLVARSGEALPVPEVASGSVASGSDRFRSFSPKTS